MSKKDKNAVLSSTIFSISKRIVPSSAAFYGAKWDERNNNVEPLVIYDKTVRGTMSHHIKSTVAGDPLKLKREIEKSNIQRVDECALSVEHDTLIARFSINFLPIFFGLDACNNPDYANKYLKYIDKYSEVCGFKELASRYVFNLVSGRWLWKNRVGAEKGEIVVEYNEFGTDTKKSWTFDMNNVGRLESPSPELDELISVVVSALNGKRSHALLNVKASVLRGPSQIVYPSQEFVQDKNGSDGAKSKVLYAKNGIAGLHDQKIGNAIRTIDTWYPNFEEFGRAIPVEVYGTVTSRSTAYRNPTSRKDYHSLMADVMSDKDISEEDMHYLSAMLIRGGVLGTEK